MSGRLVSAVFDSALPAWLKPYAAACASFAADDGTRVYPSIARVARMVGRCDRATRTAMHELRRRGVLILDVPHAPHRAARYRFNLDALPAILDPGQLSLFTSRDFNRFPQAYTGGGLPVMGEVGFTRSVSDPLFSTHQYARARKGKYPKTGTE